MPVRPETGLFMSPTIKLLDEDTKNLIAAGEVVERPAAVVKELVENALDAGARRITIECEGAGNRLIRVIDDGAGMDAEDAQLAFCRHATSKIRSAADLQKIATLGFRGEALPSIASVSRFELETRSAAGVEGTLIVVEGGRAVEVSAAPRAVGTTASVRNLFYNVPARRKFLKSDQTELRQISRCVTAIAIAQIETGFRLVHEGRELIAVNPCGSLAERVEELFGGRRKENYLPVYYERGAYVVGGLICAPDSVSGSRPEQYLFINRRPFQSRAVSHAVRQGYSSTLPESVQPSYFIFFTLDPAEVDVNVHPAKLEVRFRDEGLVYSLAYRAVQQGLGQEGATPSFQSAAGGKLISSSGVQGAGKPLRGRMADSHPAGLASAGYQTSFLMPVARPVPAQAKSTGGAAQPSSAAEPAAEPERTLPAVWQLHGRYIFAQTSTGCLIIDQHAAHERVIYERITGEMAARGASSQRLLFPVTLGLSAEERIAVDQFEPLLERAGFEIELYSGNTVLVRAVPALDNLGDVDGYFRGLLADLSAEDQGSTGTRQQVLARSLACRAAIKSGQALSVREMGELIDQLFATSLPYADVHGRNTIVELKLDEINRRFGRT